MPKDASAEYHVHFNDSQDQMPSTISDALQQALNLAHSGILSEAETICEQLLTQPVIESETRHLLGVIRNIQGRYSEAETLLRQAVTERPAIAKYQSNLGNALRGLERLEEAEVCYRQALTLDPGFDDARANLAKLLYATHSWDEAIGEYRILIRHNPLDVESHASLSFLLESGNHLAEAEEVASAGLKLAPNNPTMNLAMAICERSAGKAADAMRRLETMDPGKMDKLQAAEYYCERGLLYDRFNRIEDAWVDFAEANRLQVLGVQNSNVNKDRYVEGLERRAQLDISWAENLPAAPGAPHPPVFLVGFPRSGTTLLDQILDSHPRIQTLEEKPIINRLCEDIEEMVGDRPDCLKHLTHEQLARLRELYFEYVADFMELGPDNLLVDKLPLNVTRVPYILRIFPNARFILALRHPCDCVLSCYMHLFDLNDAMANFYTLEDTAALYARVMSLWRHWVEVLPLRYHLVYYENLVHDLPAEVKPLVDFLGVEWHEEMARPHEHAARRGHINTPSYSQVIQPIYQRAAGRWRRYLPYMHEVMGTLQPYIDYFGYDG